MFCALGVVHAVRLKVSDLLVQAVDQNASASSKKPCNSEDVSAACGALGGRSDGTTSLLAIVDHLDAKSADIEVFLEAVGIPLLNHSNVFLCSYLCEKTIAAAPRILLVKVPEESGRGCLDADCEAQVRVDDAALQVASAPTSLEAQHVTHKVSNKENPRRDDLNESGTDAISYTTGDLVRIVAGMFQVFLRADVKMRLARKYFDAWRDRVLQRRAESQNLEPPSLLERSGVVRTRQLSLGGTKNHSSLPPVIGNGLKTLRSDDDLARVTAAALEGSVWISAAIRRLDHADQQFREWFGKDDQITKIFVRKVLFRMLHAINNLYLVRPEDQSDCGSMGLAFVRNVKLPDASLDAYGRPSAILSYAQTGEMIWIEEDNGEKVHKFIVNLCDNFFNFKSSEQSEFYGTLVHEVSHHFGRTDVQEPDSGRNAYGMKLTRKLAANPVWALNNAENYLFFVYSLTVLVNAQESDSIESGEYRTCEQSIANGGTQTVTPAAMCMRMTSRMSLHDLRDGGSACDEDPHLHFTTRKKVVSLKFSSVCYYFCKQVEYAMYLRGEKSPDAWRSASGICNGLDSDFEKMKKKLGDEAWETWGTASKKTTEQIENDKAEATKKLADEKEQRNAQLTALRLEQEGLEQQRKLHIAVDRQKLASSIAAHEAEMKPCFLDGELATEEAMKEIVLDEDFELHGCRDIISELYKRFKGKCVPFCEKVIKLRGY